MTQHNAIGRVIGIVAVLAAVMPAIWIAAQLFGPTSGDDLGIILGEPAYIDYALPRSWVGGLLAGAACHVLAWLGFVWMVASALERRLSRSQLLALAVVLVLQIYGLRGAMWVAGI